MQIVEKALFGCKTDTRYPSCTKSSHRPIIFFYTFDFTIHLQLAVHHRPSTQTPSLFHLSSTAPCPALCLINRYTARRPRRRGKDMYRVDTAPCNMDSDRHPPTARPLHSLQNTYTAPKIPPHLFRSSPIPIPAHVRDLRTSHPALHPSSIRATVVPFGSPSPSASLPPMHQHRPPADFPPPPPQDSRSL